MTDDEAPDANGTASATEDAERTGAPTSDDDAEGARTEGASGDDAEGAGTKASGGASTGRDADGFDLRGIVKQFTAPMIESLDARLREQVEAHADALMDQKVDAAVSDRMATIERAIADLSRSISSLERRLEALERAGAPAELE